MSSSSHIQLSRSNPEETGYAEYQPELATYADDGYGGASRTRNAVFSLTPEVAPEIATFYDDGYGAAIS